jgi:hypothetical protein
MICCLASVTTSGFQVAAFIITNQSFHNINAIFTLGRFTRSSSFMSDSCVTSICNR